MRESYARYARLIVQHSCKSHVPRKLSDNHQSCHSPIHESCEWVRCMSDMHEWYVSEMHDESDMSVTWDAWVIWYVSEMHESWHSGMSTCCSVVSAECVWGISTSDMSVVSAEFVWDTCCISTSDMNESYKCRVCVSGMNESYEWVRRKSYVSHISALCLSVTWMSHESRVIPAHEQCHGHEAL